MAWMMELASLIFLTDVVLLFSKSVHFNATIYVAVSEKMALRYIRKTFSNEKVGGT